MCTFHVSYVFQQECFDVANVISFKSVSCLCNCLADIRMPMERYNLNLKPKVGKEKNKQYTS